jgi:hypothetical protein
MKFIHFLIWSNENEKENDIEACDFIFEFL